MRQNEKNVSPMSNEARNTYVIEHITKALLALWGKQALEDISISELCEKAGVGRASFYRNFDSKEAVVADYLHQIFRKYMEENINLSSQPLSIQLEALFAHFEKHHAFYKLLNQRKMLYLLENEMVDAYGLKPENTMIEAYSRAYVAYAMYGWVRVWFMRGMQETAEEISKLFQSQGL